MPGQDNCNDGWAIKIACRVLCIICTLRLTDLQSSWGNLQTSWGNLQTSWVNLQAYSFGEWLWVT